ncbi:hypothetical protein BgiMline_006504, partial [Biomphalaria glabrata]
LPHHSSSCQLGTFNVLIVFIVYVVFFCYGRLFFFLGLCTYILFETASNKTKF